MGEQNHLLTIVIVFLAAVAIFMGLIILALPPREGFTELYFEDLAPKEATIGKTTSFSFGIRNLEAEYMSYQYQVSLEDRVIDSGMVNVAKGESAIVGSSFILGKSDEADAAKLSVRLVGKGEEIHCWVMPE